MQRPSNTKNLSLSASILNSLYLGKTLIYNGSAHSLRPYKGNIINIAYYSNLEPIPYAEVRLKIWNNKTVTKILPLSDVVLIASSKTKSNSKKSIAA